MKMLYLERLYRSTRFKRGNEIAEPIISGNVA